jgi:HlyD family secretion protein
MSSVLAAGQLSYADAVVLSPEVIGKVTAIHVREGQQVRRGDLLLSIDDQSLRAELAEQDAAVRQQRIAIEQQQLNLRNQETQFARKLELHTMKMLADAALDDARYTLNLAGIELRNSELRLEQAQAVLRQSAERLSKTKVHAPLAGTVVALDIKVGETAVPSQVGIPGSSLMTIARADSLVAEIDVDEAAIARVAIGQEVALHTPAYPDTPVRAQVALIPLSPKRVPQGAVPAGPLRYAVRAQLAAFDRLALRPGMRCRAEIYTGAHEKVLAVPLQAVLSDDEDGDNVVRSPGRAAPSSAHYVYVDAAGKAEKRNVTVGASDDSRQQVLTGLAEGDAVIVGPYRTLRGLKAGDRVAPGPLRDRGSAT